jgi:hypothetical protein
MGRPEPLRRMPEPGPTELMPRPPAPPPGRKPSGGGAAFAIAGGFAALALLLVVGFVLLRTRSTPTAVKAEIPGAAPVSTPAPLAAPVPATQAPTAQRAPAPAHSVTVPLADDAVAAPAAEPEPSTGLRAEALVETSRLRGDATVVYEEFEMPAVASGAGEGVPRLYLDLEQDFVKRGYKKDEFSGNFLAPRTAARTLKEPLVVLTLDGKMCKDMRGNPVRLRKSVAERVQRADEKMYKARKHHLKIGYGFRSNQLQQEIYNKLKPHGGVVAPPGHSFHETGQAVDLSMDTWKEAQRFLLDEGLIGGCKGIEDDVVHFSLGEITPPKGFWGKLGKTVQSLKCEVKYR